MSESIFLPQPINEQLRDIRVQEFMLTNHPEQIFVFEPEHVISSMVRSLQIKRMMLLEHKALLDAYDASPSLAARAEANV